MKYLIIILQIVAAALIIFNITKVDFDAPLTGESFIAIITIVASGCAILLIQILRLSKRIEKQQRNKM